LIRKSIINMSMTPQEKLNIQIWEVLQDIKEEYLVTEKGKPVKYKIPNVIGAGIIPKERRKKILYKLQEQGAFKIQYNSRGVRVGRDDLFYLFIKRPTFDKVYKNYKKACDVSSYLRDFQEKLLKKEEKPKFSQVKLPSTNSPAFTQKLKKSEDLRKRYNQTLNDIRQSARSSRKLKKRYDDAIKEIRVSSAKTKKLFSPSSYNEISHTISFKNKEIPIPPNSNQSSLCKVVFKNTRSLQKEWSWDEMLEEWGGSFEGKDLWRKVYNAGREVNKKIAIETGIKDFFIAKKLTIALNPKHLN